MKRVEFVYQVKMELTLTRTDLVHLRALSGRHYDGKCKAASSAGGFLYGWNNMFDAMAQTTPEGPEVQVCATWENLDTLCKITEDPGADLTLAMTVRNLFKEMRDEHLRVNNG